MGNETHMIEYERTETETNLKTETKTKREGRSRLKESSEVSWGVRALMTSPLPACEKLDRMFGSGGEAIIHHMWFESGQSLFDNMMKCNPGKSLEELLRVLIEAQLCTGWGHVSMRIIHHNPPMVDITVKNSPVKTVKGSQKYLIGSFWAGVLSKYFNRQLICKSFGYDCRKDEFSCTVTI